MTEFVVPNTATPIEITVGSDGNLWMTDYLQLVKMTAPGQYSYYPIAGADALHGIASGSDGNIWFTNLYGYSVGKLVIR